MGNKLTIYSTRGHRRAGHKFSKEPTVFEADAFDKDQMKQLKADPDIIIVEGEAPKAADDVKAAKEIQKLSEQNQKLRDDLTAANAEIAKLKEAAKPKAKSNG